MAKIQTEVGEVKRVCAPSCKKNLKHEPCACTEKTKVVTKVEIFAVFEGVRRYRAYFSPNPRNPGSLPRISNKERFNEQGQPEEVNVQIPDTIYVVMARRALAIINSGAPQL